MKTRQQYAALPFVKIGKQLEFLLITKRRSGRWIIPKGWPETELSGHQLAALEAYEEAGLKGRIGKKEIGTFQYVKQLDDDSKVICQVTVFALRVSAQYLDWPEKNQRQLRWVKKKKACELVEEQELATLIENFDPLKKSKRRKAKRKTTSKSKSKNATKKKSKRKARNKTKLKPGIRASF